MIGREQAAILAAALTGLAAAGSPGYVRLAGLALLTAAAVVVLGPVRQQLDRYGINPDAWYDTPGEALDAFRAAGGAAGDRPG